MEIKNHKKSLFSAISINRITAARFREFSKKVASSHSQTLDDMMDFFEVTKISPRSPIFRNYLGLYNHLNKRLDFIISLLREHEEKYHKPTYNMLARIFQQPEILETESKPLKEKNRRKLTKEEWEREEGNVFQEKYELLKQDWQKDRSDFAEILSRINKIEPTFGKPYYKIEIDFTELHILKRRYEE